MLFFIDDHDSDNDNNNEHFCVLTMCQSNSKYFSRTHSISASKLEFDTIILLTLQWRQSVEEVN